MPTAIRRVPTDPFAATIMCEEVYVEWLEDVDQRMSDDTGWASHNDAQLDYHEMFMSGQSPRQAARAALQTIQ